MRNTTRARAHLAIGPALLATTMLAGVPALAQETSGLETVVVTAEKRSENLQKVPMVVNAITSQKLEDLHLTDFTDFARYLPNVTYAVSGQGSNGGPGFANITMRGIVSDQNGNHSGPEPTVGVYFDEQPITTINGTLDIPAYDVQRVEALSGPQGTLYGASAESGVIRIISNKPDPSAFAASFETSVNSVDHGGVGYSAHGMINQPLADNIALRIVAWDEHDAGYIDNVLGTRTYTYTNANPAVPGTPITISNAGHTKNNYNTVNKLGARAALGIDLDNNWTITPTFMFQDEDSDGVFGFDPNFAGDLKVQHFLPEYVHDNWYQAALTVQGKIGDLDLVYSGGYMDRHVHSAADYTDYTYWYDQYNSYYTYFTDNAGNQIDPTQRILGNDHFTKQSHELRLSSSKEDRLRFVGGLFYEDQKHYILQDYVIENLASPGSGQPVVSVTGWPNTLWLTDESREDQDYAAFGEAAFDILPNLTITGGIRFYSYDNSLKGFFGFSGYEASKCFAPSTVDSSPCTDLNSRAKGNGETHKVNLTWNVTDDKLVYATYSTGFRPGGANRVTDPSTGHPFPAYSPDSLDNYEIGWKTSWNDNTIRFNGAFYWENWNNFQFPFLGPNSVTIVENGGQARVKGFEYELSWLPIDGFTLSSSGAYNDGSLTQPFCRDTTIVCTNAVANAPAGTQLPITPLWKINAIARYDWTIGNFNAHVQGSLVHQSGTWSDLRLFERSLLGKNKPFTTFDFTTGLERDDWSIEFFIQNLTDERGELGRYAECTPGTCGSEPYILPTQPRTIGLTFSKKF
ncbi:MAG TPA: TonB-dependent receptor [Rhizomicrobium sp.]|jgi:outer membrane receptor protein involved in Fe transport